MGLVKSLAKIFGGFLFTTFLSLSLLLIGLVEFTSYSNLKPFISELLANTLSEQLDASNLNQLLNTLKQNCANKEFIDVDIGGSSIKVKCSEISPLQSKDLTKLIAPSLFDSLYYKEYNCDVLDCLKKGGIENLPVLISVKGNEFLKSIQGLFWITTLVGALMMYFSIDTLKGRLRVFGTNLAFIGGSYLALNYLIDLLIPPQIAELNIKISDVSNALFSGLTNYFIGILVLGVVLIVASMLIKQNNQLKRKK